MVKKNKIAYLTLLGTVFAFASNAAEIKCNTAQMQAMDKITGRVSIIEAPVDEEVKFGTFSVIVRDCYTRSPEETPENFAFVDVADYPLNEDPVNIFKGWMLSSNPAINPVEHPIYDVWLLKCLNKDNDETKKLSAEELAERDNMKSTQTKDEAQELEPQEIVAVETEDITEQPSPDDAQNVIISDEDFVEFPVSEEDYENPEEDFSF